MQRLTPVFLPDVEIREARDGGSPATVLMVRP